MSTWHQGFEPPLDQNMARQLRDRARAARGTVLTATSVAASGHPGGSFSSMELYTVLYSCARLRPSEPRWSARDRIVISHGHTSPGAYSALAEAGFFSRDEVAAHFRQAGSPFEGHVERSVPGIEWSSGNLGQGLSAGVGMALGARMTGLDWHTYVVMSDGEQQKGQVAEARRVAVKENLTELTVLVDYNHVQISGHTDEVMPVPIVEDWHADGWRVIEVDGHDIEAIYAAVSDATQDTAGPVCVIAHTVIGKGVAFMEDEPEFHGRGLSDEEYATAMAEIGLPSALHEARVRRAEPVATRDLPVATPSIPVEPGRPRTYGVDDKTDNRSAWGAALVDLAEENPDVRMAVFDCDLAGSVKTADFAKRYPDRFVQFGVGEHNAATAAGALSTCGVLTFWADFGVFGLDEVYNQQRLNDINGTNLKVTLTHCGLDVGEDGKTHQCLDYVGAFRNLFGWKIIVPADPNQTDRGVRAMAAMQGPACIAMGRSKLPTIATRDGSPAFGDEYRFEYGRIDWVREGEDACVLVMGTPAGAVVRAADACAADGLSVAVGVVSAPLDLEDDAMRTAVSAPVLMTVEDHSVHSGLAASVAYWMAREGRTTRLVPCGVASYQPSGAAGDLMAAVGLDEAGIEKRLREVLMT